MKRIYLITFLILTLFLAGCGGNSVIDDKPNNPTTTGSLAGKIIEIITNDPLAGVNILLQDTDYSAVTDNNGKYRIDNVPEGDYIIQVVKDSHEMQTKPTYIPSGDTWQQDFSLFPYHPVTEDRPSLTFYWDDLSTSTDILVASPFGWDDNGAPCQELAIFFQNHHRDPVYAFCGGVISYYQPYSNFETAMNNGEGGEVWIRYGKNFAIGYRHVVTTDPTGTPLNIQVGQRVKQGDIIAYGADLSSEIIYNNNGIFFEFVVTTVVDDIYYFLNPYWTTLPGDTNNFSFFEQSSQDKLLEIWQNADQDYSATFGYDPTMNPWGNELYFENQGNGNEIISKGRL